MRREPVQNNLESSMFHSGGQIRMPAGGEVHLRGYYKNEWKMVHLPKLKYDDPDEIMRREAWRNRWLTWHEERRGPPKKRRKRTAWIRIRPLNRALPPAQDRDPE